MTQHMTSTTGTAAGVPFLAIRPAGDPTRAPVVIGWHLQDAPRTEAAFAAAIPLAGLDAWRIYLGLPMSGARLPDGGLDEFQRLGAEDAVLNIYGPVAEQAVREFAPALVVLRKRFGLRSGPVGLFGGSMGAAVAQLILAETDAPVAAAVLISPLIQLRPVVETIAEQYGIQYPWSARSDAVAARLDLVARADEVARRQTAIRFIVGENDSAAITRPAAELCAELKSSAPGRTDLVTVTGMEHALAEEPGVEPAPQTPQAAVVDQRAVEWFERYLTR